MFGFPIVDRSIIKKFGRNFIRSLIFQLKYGTVDLSTEKKEDLKKLFSKSLPIEGQIIETRLDFQQTEDQTPIISAVPRTSLGFELMSIDKQKKITFLNNSLTLTYPGNQYSNFNNFKKDEFGQIKKVIKTLKIDTLKRVAIRKINVVEFDVPDDIQQNKIDAYSAILNQDLLTNLNCFPNRDLIDHKISSVKYKKDNYNLHLRYGVVPKAKRLPIKKEVK